MPLRALLFWSTLFAAAFGVIEGAVVVYLRAIAYPEGFAFPLKPVETRLLSTELVRELATLALLLAFAFVAVRGRHLRFAVFAFCFGVWDVVYYVALKAFLDWPESLLTWDVLFLIPVVWTGPVLAPILVSLSLMAAAVAILARPTIVLRPTDWVVEIAAGCVVLASFFWNAAEAVPRTFPWWLFLLGWCGGMAWFVRIRAVAGRVADGRSRST